MIRRKTAAGHHAVQMRMMQQILSPGMQDGEETDLRTSRASRGIRSYFRGFGFGVACFGLIPSESSGLGVPAIRLAATLV